MADRRNWSAGEVREALALYLITDFGRFHSRNPDVIRLAGRLDRTPGAVALKLSNLAALDDSLAQKGMANASKTDRIVWEEFLADPTGVELAYAAQTAFTAPTSAGIPGLSEAPGQFDHRGGAAFRPAQQRIGQDLFRRTVLTSYGGRCALTGAEDTRLLTASHILPWAEAPAQRMWPTNGICLNALHDRAFDRHLITFDDEWRLVISPSVPPEARRLLERGVSGRLEMPHRFQPDSSFMAQHRERFAAG